MQSPIDRLPLSTHKQTDELKLLDPATTALLVVDLQYFDAHRDWGEGRTAKELGVSQHFEKYFLRVDEILPRVQELLSTFRAQSAEVIHVRVAERTADSRDVSQKQLVRGLIVPSTSKEAEFLEEVAPYEDEMIFDKSSSGMFPATDIDRILRNLEIRTLVFCGTSTDGCVESAVRDAVDLGYEIIVVSDACAASTPQAHTKALTRMMGPTTAIATTAQVNTALTQSPSRNRHATAGTQRVRGFLPLPTATTEYDSDPYALIFPPPQCVDVRTFDTALIVLDAHVLATDPNSPLLSKAQAVDPTYDLQPFLSRVDDAIEGLANLLRAAHRNNVPVIHVCTAGRTRSGEDLAPAIRAMLGALPADSSTTALDSRLPSDPNDLVLAKPGQGPFTGTGLDETLRNLGISKIVLGGISTLGSVEAALRGASDRGYQVLLVPEACAADSSDGQQDLHKMASGLIEVTDLADAITRISEAKKG